MGFVGGDAVDEVFKLAGDCGFAQQAVVGIERIEPPLAEAAADAIAEEGHLGVLRPDSGVLMDERLEQLELGGR